MIVISPIQFLRNAALPISANEDIARREFILYVLLLGTIVLLSIGFLANLADFVLEPANEYQENSLPLAVMGSFLLFIFGLYKTARASYIKTASYAYFSFLFALPLYLDYVWGVDLPAAILLQVLAIVVAGVLIDTHFAFIATILVCASVVLLGLAQRYELIGTNRVWALRSWELPEMITASCIFFIIAIVSWLSNREIEKSLIRARRSEIDLMLERDQLEVRVQERTNELRKAELERMAQAYRFVEFGRLAGSLFHDLGNPLTALSLNIESIARGADNSKYLASITEDVKRARSATNHMQKLMESMRKHLASEGRHELFSLDHALTESVQLLKSYARSRKVTLELGRLDIKERVGDPIAFTQIVTNLISNAIESFPRVSEEDPTERHVRVELLSTDEGATVTVADTGPGMSEGTCSRILEPFFSTKSDSGGLGIGLSLAKRLLEKEFNGSLSVESEIGTGTTFTIYFPH